jgi:hypothetical protein
MHCVMFNCIFALGGDFFREAPSIGQYRPGDALHGPACAASDLTSVSAVAGGYIGTNKQAYKYAMQG